jgi:hypothetical protein
MNGFTEDCNAKIKVLKQVSYSLRNGDVYWRKMYGVGPMDVGMPM